MALREQQLEMAKGLLGRGGSSLLVAAVARARGIRVGQRRWHVLAPDIVASVEQVLTFLEREQVSEAWLELAVHQALKGDAIASVPGWLRPVADREDALSLLGDRIATEELRSALGYRMCHPSQRQKGVAAVAIALSRMQDTLDTLCRMLSSTDGALLARMGRLAAARVEGGEPTRMRMRVREALKELTHGENHQGG